VDHLKLDVFAKQPLQQDRNIGEGVAEQEDLRPQRLPA
jgi:hypothetical protein